MIISALIPLILLVLIILLIRKLIGRDTYGSVTGNSVRRFFQYLLMYGLLVISGIGFYGLLGRIFSGESFVAVDQTELARNFSFVVVGIPLYALFSLWTRRKFATELGEAKSLGWTFYITAASITALLITFYALRDILGWAVSDGRYSGNSIARVIVWGAIWGAHWWVDSRVTPNPNSRYQHFAGSLIGLVALYVGLSDLLAACIYRLFHLGGAALFIRSGDSIWVSSVTLLAGIPVWILYWLRTYSKSSKDALWSAYVLLAGVAGGLVVAIAGASTVFYEIFVWLIGDPSSTQASTHFQSTPNFAGTALVGFLIWWYHHRVIDGEEAKVRTEIERIYEYLMAGIGLVAAAGGFGVLLTALIAKLTSATPLVGGSGSGNTLIAAGTLLIVGGPVWWVHWSKIGIAVQKFPVVEHASAVRRIYLFLLFGVGGLVGVVAILFGVFLLFDDSFKGNFGISTFHKARFTVSILATALTVAGYHWIIYKSERDLNLANKKSLQFVLLVGPRDLQLVREIALRTGARVQSWNRTDEIGFFGTSENVLQLLSKVESDYVLLLAESNGVKAIPLERD